MAIEKLPAQLVNQIAAGEVVERPSSVLKELIENSIDAGADHIEIDVEQGGLALMSIRDNGCGIEKDQLGLALSRHATSKIKSLQDLQEIATMGFRGEALPSISSVSRLTLSSRTPESATAWQVTADGTEDIAEARPVAQQPGTVIDVRDLFYNVPARRKFLKAERTEFSHIQTLVRKMALSHFELGFSLTHNQREMFRFSPAADQQQKEIRVSAFLGKAFIDNALAIDFSAAGYRLWGWIGFPSYTRAQPDQQHFFLNRRLIRDKSLSHAVKQAYQDVMFHGRFAVYLLYLEMPAERVDVNAHPAKLEVRFRDSRSVHDFVVQAVRNGLQAVPTGNAADQAQVELASADLSKTADPASAESLSPEQLTPEQLSPKHDTMIRESQPSYQSPARQQALPLGPDVGSGIGAGTASKFSKHSDSSNVAPIASRPSEAIHINTQRAADIVESGSEQDVVPPLGYALAHLHNIYILAESRNGLVLVDAHAGHERIVYEKMKKQLAVGKMPVQPLLLPVTVAVSEAEADLLMENTSILTQMGLEIERQNQQHIQVKTVPALLANVDIEGLLKDIVADLQALEGSDRAEYLSQRILGNMSCRGAIRAGRRLSKEEMNQLLRDMETTPLSGVCNHGRPSWVELDKKALDQLFLRGQ